MYHRTVGHQTLVRFSRTYPGSCWVMVGKHLFTTVSLPLNEACAKPSSPKKEGCWEGPGIFKQNELCSDLCLWYIIVVMIIAKRIPSVWFITSNLKVLSSDYIKSMRPNSALSYLGVTPVSHSRYHWLVPRHTESTNRCLSSSVPNCKVQLIPGQVSELFRTVPANHGLPRRTRGSWFQLALVK